MTLKIQMWLGWMWLIFNMIMTPVQWYFSETGHTISNINLQKHRDNYKKW